jgi:hypothetical protein
MTKHRRSMRWLVVPGSVLLVSSVMLVVTSAQQEPPKGAPAPPPHQLSGRLLQELKAFDNPEAAIFSEDGQFVFIANSAELGMPDKGFHWTEKAGFVSKLSVEADGTLKMVNQRLVTGLTAPLGMAVNPVATKKFPKGSIFLCTGGLPLADASGVEIKDPTRLTSRIVVFNVDGQILGEIPWNEGAVLSKVTGAPATLPNAAAFDRQGNLYLTDTGLAGGTLEPKLEARPGVVMIPHGALDALAAGNTPGSKPLFIPMPGGPDGVEGSPVDGTIHVNSVGTAAGLSDTDKGGMWRLSRNDFVAGRLPRAFSGGWGALDGLVFTRKGTRLDTQILPPNYITVVAKGGSKVMSLKITGLTRDLAGPADIAIHSRRDGTSLLVIPELSATSPNNNENPILVVLLPAGL